MDTASGPNAPPLSRAERLTQLKRDAWDARDFELVTFYTTLEFDLQRLRSVGKLVAALYEHGLSDEGWNALFEALSDAGLLDTTEGGS